MDNDYKKDYGTPKVEYKNVYNPVEYMLKRARKRSIAMMDNELNRRQKEENEGGTLYRDGAFLEKVEGDTYRDYLLYYNDKRVLDYFVVAHKITGRIEQWNLYYANNVLIRYEYTLVNEGSLEEEHDDSDAMWDGWGTSIDPYL